MRPSARRKYRKPKVCCICGLRHGPLQRYSHSLAAIEFKDRGYGTEWAVLECVERLFAEDDRILEHIHARHTFDLPH